MAGGRPQQHDICLVIADLSGGGGQRVLTQLAAAWSERGRRVCVVTFGTPQSDAFPLDPRATRVCLGGIGPSHGTLAALRANLARLLALRRAIRASRAPTVVSFIGTTNILTVLATMGLKVRVVISERNDPARQTLGRVWDHLRRLIYPRADVVTANSRAALDSLARFVPRRKLAFVANPLKLPTQPPGTETRERTILNVGRLTTQKAQDVLLDGFAALGETARDWRLVIVGGGEAGDALHRQAEALGIARRVDFTGQVADPFPYYQRAGIFVLPSRFEGTPNALLEAMACGLPSIVSDASGGPLAYVENERTGLVVPADDAEALAAAMRRLITDEPLRARLAVAARERIAMHDADDALATWEDVLGWQHETPGPGTQPA